MGLKQTAKDGIELAKEHLTEEELESAIPFIEGYMAAHRDTIVDSGVLLREWRKEEGTILSRKSWANRWSGMIKHARLLGLLKACAILQSKSKGSHQMIQNGYCHPADVMNVQNLSVREFVRTESKALAKKYALSEDEMYEFAWKMCQYGCEITEKFHKEK